MKTIFLFMAMILCSNIYAQSFQKVTVSLLDGTTIEGTGKFNPGHMLVFKKDDGTKREILNDRKIYGFIIQTHSGEEVYEYKTVETSKKGRKELFQLVESGKLNLYRRRDPGSGMYMGGMLVMRAPKHMYYHSKPGEDILTALKNTNPISGKFESEVSEIFSDCPGLISKINSRYFTRTGLHQVFAYYNNPQNCL